jgi:hypothetical protein
MSRAKSAPSGDDTEPIETKMKMVRENIGELKKLQTIHLAENSKKSKAKLATKNEEIVKLMAEIKDHIDFFEKRTKTDKKLNAQEKSGRAATAKNYREQLLELGKAIMDGRESHDSALTDAVESRVNVRFGGEDGVTPAQAKKMAQELVKSRREDQIFLLARAELEQALETYREVCEIETSVRELRELMQHLQLMVHQQSETLEQAQKSQETANDDMKKANEDLEAAKNIKCIVQ